MNKIVEIIAIVSGIVATFKGVLGLLKEYRSNTETLAVLLKQRRFRIGAILTIIGVILIVGAIWFAVGRAVHTLTVQIWSVEFDEKGSVVASKRFSVAKGGQLPDELLRQIGQWVKNEIEPKKPEPRQSIDLNVYIPADLKNEKIQIETTPSVEVDKYLYIIEGSDKLRVKTELDEELLGSLGKDFSLEINPAGYSRVLIDVTWGQQLQKEYTLEPAVHTVGVGIEEFGGQENNFAIRLSDFLVSNSRLAIKRPDLLDRLRKKIEEKKALIASQPWIQVQLRSFMDLNYIISGSYEIQ